MGNGAHAQKSEPIDRKDSWRQDRHEEFEYLQPKKLWHRNKEDLLAAEALCAEEEEKLKKKLVPPHEIQAHMRIYRQGVIHMRDAMVDIMRKELIPAVLTIKYDPNFHGGIDLCINRTKGLDSIRTIGLKLILRMLYSSRNSNSIESASCYREECLLQECLEILKHLLIRQLNSKKKKRNIV